MPTTLQLLYLLFLGPALSGIWAVAAKQGSLAQRLSVLPVAAVLGLLWMADPGHMGLTIYLPMSQKVPGLALAVQMGPMIYYRVGMVLAVFAGVQLYSVGYFIKRSRLYFALLSLFCIGMLTLLISGNYLTLLLGWEVIGLCSYALVSSYFVEYQTGSSALRVFLINRLGDMMLLAAVAGIYAHNGYFAFPINQTLPDWIGYLIAGAALVKAAQVPFSGWLRLAMVGPTPVSAFLHAATLVVAGVILILKTGPALGEGPLMLVGIIGMISALYGAGTALFAHNFKTMLAWSTVSHMGLLMAGAGTQALAGTGAHILAHAFFKAPLFLLVGLLPAYKMTAMLRPGTLLEQIGSYPTRTKISLFILVICALSAIGAPLLAGSFSKDALFAGMLASSLPPAAIWVFIAAYTLLMLAYTARFTLGLAAGLASPEGLASWVRPHHLAAVGLLALGVVPYAVFKTLAWTGHPATTPLLEYGYPMFCLTGFALALLLVKFDAVNPMKINLLPKYASYSGLLKSSLEPLLFFDRSLSELPLFITRAMVVMAHMQMFIEKVVIGLAAYSFRFAQWPVRSLAVNVTGYRISAILAVALLTVVGLAVLVGW